MKKYTTLYAIAWDGPLERQRGLMFLLYQGVYHEWVYTTIKDADFDNNGVLFFSTKEEAEQYMQFMKDNGHTGEMMVIPIGRS